MPKPTPKRAVKSPANDPQVAIRYRIQAASPQAHLFAVECLIPDPSPAGEVLALPAWIPGSYLIRDFARHIVSLSAEAGNKRTAARVEKIGKDQWRVSAPAGTASLRVRYEVYAWDLSVRGAHLDTTHGFFNGTSVFLRVVGREAQPCLVDIEAPAGAAYRHWRVATSLPRTAETPALAFGHYQAANYDELIDHPVEMGSFDLIEFKARGVEHRFALTGRHRADLPRLADDLKKICAWQIAFWGGKGNVSAAPMKSYTFLTTAVGDGYGGLEHRASTALLCRRDDLPRPGDKAISENYRNFLGLAAHEYFHTWLVKRIKPAEFVELDLQRENLTELLWLFEGFTSYYDDLSLLRCGLISVEDYLACLSKTIANVQGVPGRFRQSVAAASRDAWIKFYKPDENTVNSTISYYAKGALVALALDLTLREASRGKHSLDDLMRELWRAHGMTGKGVSEADVQTIAENLAGSKGKLSAFFAQALHGTEDLPLVDLLARHGIELSFKDGGAPSLGIKLAADSPPHEARIGAVFAGGAAEQAGLAGQDVLLAVDGLRATTKNLDTLLAAFAVGGKVEVHAFRRDELMRFDVVLQSAAPKTCRLALAARATAAARKRRESWLRQDQGV
jgi:predicted metalloprotease with PDZ domain